MDTQINRDEELPTVGTAEVQAAETAVTYFDSKENEWVSTDGRAVCQDHNNYLPCPHNHGRSKR